MTRPPELPLRETMPGYCHGIVSVDPPEIQCDGCGDIATLPADYAPHTTGHRRVTLALILSGFIHPHHHQPGGGPRLCRPCRDALACDCVQCRSRS